MNLPQDLSVPTMPWYVCRNSIVQAQDESEEISEHGQIKEEHYEIEAGFLPKYSYMRHEKWD